MEHLNKVIPKIAKFHALSYVLKAQKPNYIRDLKKYLEPLDSRMELVSSLLEHGMNVIRNDEKLCKYFPRIKIVMEDGLKKGYWRSSLPLQDPYTCIIHGDLWTNNILFHKHNNCCIDDVKFIDFQTYFLSSPFRELLFLLCTSSEITVINNHFDDCLEKYLTGLTSVLEKYDYCDTNIFSESHVQYRLKYDSVEVLLYIMWVIKLFTLREGESIPNDIESPIYTANEIYISRLREIIFLYVRKNWI